MTPPPASPAEAAAHDLAATTTLTSEQALALAECAEVIGFPPELIADLVSAFGAMTKVAIDALQAFGAALAAIELTPPSRQAPFYVRPQFASAYRPKARRASRRNR